MRAAFIVSAVLHLAILAAAIVQIGRTESFSTAAVAALPVELVTIEEETDLTLGEVEAEAVVEEAAPETVEAAEEPAPDEMPGATDEAADEIATDENARPDGAESTAPEPEAAPEPAPAEDTAVAEPPPPPPEPEAAPEAPAETEVAALDPAEETPPPEAAEPEPEQPAPQPETVVPSRKPPPPPRRTQRARVEQSAEDAFNADRLSQLINRTDPTGGGSGQAEASLGTATGRTAAALTLSEMDALRSQMQRCWNPPIGLANGEELIVEVQIRLAPDGSVVNIDRIGAQNVGRLYDVAADAARRAVLQCQPYRLPTSKYDAWKDVQVKFDPRDLF